MSYTPFDLSGKTVLITGGNGGIGLGMAEACAQAGADVAIWGTNEEKNENAAAQLSAYGTKAKAYRVDVSDEDGRNVLFTTQEITVPVAALTLGPVQPNPRANTHSPATMRATTPI